MAKVAIVQEVNDQDIWDGVWGGLFESVSSSWLLFRYGGEYGESTDEVVEVYTHDDGSDFEGPFFTETGWCQMPDYDLIRDTLIAGGEVPGVTLHRVTLADLVRGLTIAVTTPYYHCGYKVEANTDEWDACVADLILQCAVFGEAVYG